MNKEFNRSSWAIIVGAVHKHPNTNPDSTAYLERMLQTYSNCGKNMYMLGDLNEDLLKVNRLEQILNTKPVSTNKRTYANNEI